jgi:hypothetical protein
MEVWLYRDGVQVFAGPVVGGSISGTTLTLNCSDLLLYLQYMVLTANESWTAVDQFTIVKELVDDWQALTYGNYGISTLLVGTSGQVRTLAIPAATERVTVWEAVQDLAQANNGFDIWVDPDARTLELDYPSRGSDLTSTVFLERGIKSADARFSVAPGIIASEVYLTGTAASATPITAVKSDTVLRSTFGRCGMGASVDNVTEQAMLDDLAQAAVDLRGAPLFQPGAGLIPVAGAEFDDFGVGDQVTYAYDSGLGLQSGAYRIRRRETVVGADGTEDMKVEFQ